MKHKTFIPTKRNILLLAALAVVIVVAVIWLYAGKSGEPFESTSLAMGSYVQQTVYGAKAQDAAAAAAKSVADLENLIAWQIGTSDIAKLNAQAGSEWIPINPKTAQLLNTCLDAAAKSGGAFDPTILPISSMWDFGGDNQRLPGKDEIEKFLPYVDYQNLRVSVQDNTASLKNHLDGLDLGAVGKGAACDEAIAAYKQAGVQGAIVAVGGSIGVYGTKPDRTPWKIAVRDPFAGENTSAAGIGTISMTSGCVSTSGTYEKYFVQDGVTYHHLLDPKTGYPVHNGLVSVTITHENGAITDILSTACFILGKEKGIELAKQYGAGAVFIDENKNVTVTDNLKDSFKLTGSGYTLQGAQG